MTLLGRLYPDGQPPFSLDAEGEGQEGLDSGEDSGGEEGAGGAVPPNVACAILMDTVGRRAVRCRAHR